jgi:hypothetical protein
MRPPLGSPGAVSANGAAGGEPAKPVASILTPCRRPPSPASRARANLRPPWQPGQSGNGHGVGHTVLTLAAEIRRRTGRGPRDSSRSSRRSWPATPFPYRGAVPPVPTLDQRLKATEVLLNRGWGHVREVIEFDGEGSSAADRLVLPPSTVRRLRESARSNDSREAIAIAPASRCFPHQKDQGHRDHPGPDRRLHPDAPEGERSECVREPGTQSPQAGDAPAEDAKNSLFTANSAGAPAVRRAT